MADTKLNPIFEGFSKKIGNLVFCERNGKTIVRRLGEYHDAKARHRWPSAARSAISRGLAVAYRHHSEIMEGVRQGEENDRL
jgi:hypothetical protein